MTKVLSIKTSTTLLPGSKQVKKFSDVFIEHNGRHFYTRYWWDVPDTAQQRAYELQQFETRAVQHGYW